MGKLLIVSREETLQMHRALAEQYHTAFEINDFFDPEVLEDAQVQQRILRAYRTVGLPEGSTMHGAFLDVVVFSQDPRIRKISVDRMQQSMMLAQKLGVRGVVFHTNINPMLSSPAYEESAVAYTQECLANLLRQYPETQIYLENMFDTSPDFLIRVSDGLKEFSQYGVCFDYAHASIYGAPVSDWVIRLAPYVKHIHINDNDGKHDLHWALGKGTIDWETFFKCYNTYFKTCSILIETTRPEDQSTSLQYLTGTPSMKCLTQSLVCFSDCINDLILGVPGTKIGTLDSDKNDEE